MTPLISFIVPCYNYGRYLPDCLNSIFQQEGKHDFEIIAIDDQSTDNTQEILAQFSDPRLQVITHQKNMGHGDTINEGLSLAKGQFVARIDPDDRYRSDFLISVLEKFNQYPEVGLVYGDAAVINDVGEITIERCDRLHNNQDFKGNELVELLAQNFICAPTVIAKRELWQKFLPVPPGLAFNDWYFTTMMARETEFYYINKVLADYRVHSQNHHTKIAKNKTEETSIFWLLDKIFNEVEKDAELELKKRQNKNKIYANHYLDVGRKYFGFEFNEDAKRCYLKMLQYQPEYIGNLEIMRHLLGLIIGRKTYNYVKKIIKT